MPTADEASRSAQSHAVGTTRKRAVSSAVGNVRCTEKRDCMDVDGDELLKRPCTVDRVGSAKGRDECGTVHNENPVSQRNDMVDLPYMQQMMVLDVERSGAAESYDEEKVDYANVDEDVTVDEGKYEGVEAIDYYYNYYYDDDSDASSAEVGEYLQDQACDKHTVDEGGPLNVGECAAAIVSFMLNHNVSGSCVEDLLALISELSPTSDFEKLIWCELAKYFEFTPGFVNKKFYCSECSKPLVMSLEVCAVCNNQGRASYFIQIPLIPQLEILFARPGFCSSLNHRLNRKKGLLADIYDGQLYQDHVNHGILSDPNSFSMTFYTDGDPVLQSTNYKFWRFSLTINELPYEERLKQENTLLAGLWCGIQNPDFDLVMMSFNQDFKSLLDGVDMFVPGLNQKLPVRGLVLAGLTDIRVTNTLLKCGNHNDFWGCTACEIRGESPSCPSNGNDVVYRYETPLKKRTVNRMLAQGIEAVQSSSSVMGMTGLTSLRFFMHDFSRGTVVDVMQILISVVRKLLELQFNSRYHAESFSLRAVIHLVDTLLFEIRPPNNIPRLSKSVENVCRWTDSDLKMWIYYYSVPILKEFMEPVYFNHYLKLVVAFSHLSATSIPIAMVNVADQLLHEFVVEFEHLYDLQFCSVKIHMLLHVADHVREFGPTWVLTSSPHQRINNELSAVIHGGYEVAPQVAQLTWQFLELPLKLQSLRKRPIKEFCFNPRKTVKVGERLSDFCYIVGALTHTDSEDPLVHRALRSTGIRFVQLRRYSRLVMNGLVYEGERNVDDLESTCSHVSYFMNNQLAYGIVLTFVKLLQCICQAHNCGCAGEHYAIVKGIQKLSNVRVSNDLHLHYLFSYRVDTRLYPIPVQNLKSLCFFISVNDKLYLAEPINTKHDFVKGVTSAVISLD